MQLKLYRASILLIHASYLFYFLRHIKSIIPYNRGYMKISFLKQYREAFLVNIILFFLSYGYTTYTGEYADSLTRLRHAFGDVFLLSLALFLSFPAWCYFWKGIFCLEKYKKTFLIVGIWYGIANSVISGAVHLFPGMFGSGDLNIFFMMGILLIVIIIIGFFLYRVFSLIAQLGTVMWGNLYPLGYVFLLISCVLITLTEYGDWYEWIAFPQVPFPPVHFVLILFIIFTMGLRLHMENHKRLKKES